MEFNNVELLIENQKIKVTSMEIANILQQENKRVNRKIEEEWAVIKDETEIKSYDHELKDGGVVKRTYYLMSLRTGLYIISCFRTKEAKQILFELSRTICGRNNIKISDIVAHEEIDSRFMRSEEKFGKVLENVLNPMGIKIIRQKHVLNNKYRIDFYLPEFNLAIEYDEEFHKRQIIKDSNREIDIAKELNCDFVRVSYKNNDEYNVGIVMKKLFDMWR